jgi:5'(3')-deoxyribonucleotidase
LKIEALGGGDWIRGSTPYVEGRKVIFTYFRNVLKRNDLIENTLKK